MDLKNAAEELGVTVGHLHRLIKMEALPAQKVTMQQVITKQVWDIDDNAVDSAAEILQNLKRSEQQIGKWLKKWTDNISRN